MGKWSVYKGEGEWFAHRGWCIEPFDSWQDAFAYAYRHAQAALHEVP